MILVPDPPDTCTVCIAHIYGAEQFVTHQQTYGHGDSRSWMGFVAPLSKAKLPESTFNKSSIVERARASE